MMKLKKILPLVILILLTSFFPSLLSSIILANPDLPVHNIDTGLKYPTIQAAINANTTLTGHRLHVDPGTYYEHVIISKALSIIGENKINTIIDGSGTGSAISTATNNVTIVNFTIQNSGLTTGYSGIYIFDSNNHHISQNIIKNNYYGIYLAKSSNNILTDNNISNNGNGIWTSESNNNILSENIISSNNYYGIYQSNSSNNMLINNKISNNEYGGIYLSTANNNILSGNTISSNIYHGIYLSTANNNTIFHNNFLNNTSQLNSTGSVNSLDNGFEGNYWSDYNGTDETHDGIGDTPHIINADHRDNHPLIGIFSEFHIVIEKDTYRIFIISDSSISEFQFDDSAKIINFNATNQNDTAGFCRIMIPKMAISGPYTILIDNKETNVTTLLPSNTTHAFLYFTYPPDNHNVTIISKPYYEILKNYNNLLADFQNLNITYHELLTLHNTLLTNYTELQGHYAVMIYNYNVLLANYTQIQANYTALIANFAQLQVNLETLNATYYQVLDNYTDLKNIRNLMYIFTGTTIAGIISAIILLWFGIKYYQSFNRQKKIIQTYEHELESISQANPLEIAKLFFKTDVERRKAKIGKFEEKYGIRIRPHDALEDVIKSMRVGEKKDKDTH